MENFVSIYLSRYCLDIFVHTHSCIMCVLMPTNDNNSLCYASNKRICDFPQITGPTKWCTSLTCKGRFISPVLSVPGATWHHLSQKLTSWPACCSSQQGRVSPLSFSKWKLWVENPQLRSKKPSFPSQCSSPTIRCWGTIEHCHDNLNLVSGHDLLPQNQGSFWKDFSCCCLMRTHELTWRPRLHSASGCAPFLCLNAELVNWLSKLSNPEVVVRKSPLKDSDDFKILKDHQRPEKSACVLLSNLRKAQSNNCLIWEETVYKYNWCPQTGDDQWEARCIDCPLGIQHFCRGQKIELGLPSPHLQVWVILKPEIYLDVPWHWPCSSN